MERAHPCTVNISDDSGYSSRDQHMDDQETGTFNLLIIPKA
jgi:hypothetical protein